MKPVLDLNAHSLAASRSGLYYPTVRGWSRPGVMEYAIRFLDLESGAVDVLLEEEGFIPWDDIAVSPDEKWILHGRRPMPVSELMLVENFP